MVIRTVSTLALYCLRCGKTELHEISSFTLQRSAGKRFVCGCGQVQATVTSAGSYQYLFSIPCAICDVNHLVTVNKANLGQAEITRLYCPQENLELGFVGDRSLVEQTLASDLSEIDKLIADIENDDFVHNPQIMFEIINKVHDIAEKGKLCCNCGRSAIVADILPECIKLSCEFCGSSLVIPAETEQDLARVSMFETITLPRGRRRRHKH